MFLIISDGLLLRGFHNSLGRCLLPADADPVPPIYGEAHPSQPPPRPGFDPVLLSQPGRELVMGHKLHRPHQLPVLYADAVLGFDCGPGRLNSKLPSFTGF